MLRLDLNLSVDENISAALQTVFPSDPFTFSLQNGTAFTTDGVATNVILPLRKHKDLYTYCTSDGLFCQGQTISVYVSAVK